MDCKEVSEAIFLFVDHEMTDDLLTSFQAHLARCPGCCKQINYTQKLLFIVRERCSRCTAPETLRHRILTSLPHRHRRPLRPS